MLLKSLVNCPRKFVFWWKPKVYHRVHKRRPFHPIINQSNPCFGTVCIPLYLPETNCNNYTDCVFQRICAGSHTGILVKNGTSTSALYVSTLILKPKERVTPNLFLEWENRNTCSTKQQGYANVKGTGFFLCSFLCDDYKRVYKENVLCDSFFYWTLIQNSAFLHFCICFLVFL